jgi:hypothetical protein
MLLLVLMATHDAPQPARWALIAVILIAVLIDAVLFAQVHVNFLRDHGYDVPLRRPAAAKPAPP